MKKCNKCLKEKDLSDYYVNNNICKSCKIEYAKVRSQNKSEEIKEYKKQYRKKNSEKIKIQQHILYEENREERLRRSKEYYQCNKDKKIEYQKNYSSLNKEKRNNYLCYRKKTDPIYRFSCSLKNMIYNSLKRKGYSKNSNTYDIIGCSYEFFKGYIESKFEQWMSWDNYGLYNGEVNYGWDIDHIKPLSMAKSFEELICLNHYSNLQPLCSKYNRDIKRDKFDE